MPPSLNHFPKENTDETYDYSECTMKIKNAILLLLTFTIWGITFVAQLEGCGAVNPLLCVRSPLVLPVSYFDSADFRFRKTLVAAWRGPARLP